MNIKENIFTLGKILKTCQKTSLAAHIAVKDCETPVAIPEWRYERDYAVLGGMVSLKMALFYDSAISALPHKANSKVEICRNRVKVAFQILKKYGKNPVPYFLEGYFVILW